MVDWIPASGDGNTPFLAKHNPRRLGNTIHVCWCVAMLRRISRARFEAHRRRVALLLAIMTILPSFHLEGVDALQPPTVSRGASVSAPSAGAAMRRLALDGAVPVPVASPARWHVLTPSRLVSRYTSGTASLISSYGAISTAVSPGFGLVSLAGGGTSVTQDFSSPPLPSALQEGFARAAAASSHSKTPAPVSTPLSFLAAVGSTSSGSQSLSGSRTATVTRGELAFLRALATGGRRWRGAHSSALRCDDPR